jgi:hypothetical protein
MKSGWNSRQFALAGNASITMKISTADEPVELALWKMEVGAADSPGCHFHGHVPRGVELGGRAYVLPVPRLPNFLFTFGDCLEFLVGELFQDKWVRHAGQRTPESAEWRRYQRERVSRVLLWQARMIRGATSAPWTALKAAKPPSDLFVRDEMPEVAA